jgi:pentatricopeptide repeat protein
MPAQNVTPGRTAYNVLFSALGAEGLVDEALACFQRLRDEEGLEPKAYDYGTLIAGCGNALGRLEEADEEEMERLVAVARGLLEEAEKGARVAVVPAAEGEGAGAGGLANCYVQMLKVYGKAGRWQEAGALLGAVSIKHMTLPLYIKHSHSPIIYPSIHAHTPAEMRRAGVEPTFSHYYEAMRAAAFAGQKDAALELLEEAEAATGEEVRLCRFWF